MDVASYLGVHNTLFVVAIALLGLVVGSFLNVVVYRLPIIIESQNHNAACTILKLPAKVSTLSLWKPKSFCPQCHTPISFWHNLPVVSYLVLLGKSACCGSTITIRYASVELSSAFLWLILGWRFGLSMQLFCSLILVSALFVLSVIDIQTYLLPSEITLFILWLGLLSNIWHVFVPLSDSVIGAAAGYLFFYLINGLMWKIRKVKGMGEGDFKLLAALGAWLGWRYLPLIVLIASISGLAWGMIYLFANKKEFNSPLPFGPFLALSGCIMLLWGDVIVRTLC